MQLITGSVGENGVNSLSDSALVQAILLKTRSVATPTRPAAPYLSTYDGVVGNGTKTAIRNFQTDHVFISANGTQSTNVPNATAGLVSPGDATWTKLLEKVDPLFNDMRVLVGGKTVYVAATNAQLQIKIALANAMTFTAAFRVKVMNCINRMHALYGTAISVSAQGDRRNFQQQYNLLNGPGNVTNAGPGESNHNFGMAVDLGFKDLRWLKRNGTVVEDETSWFHKMDAENGFSGESMKFWNVMREVGTGPQVGAFRGPVGDRPHLQNWNDAGVSMTARLPVLLTSAGQMRWSRANCVYTCDLGYNGAYFPVGTSSQVWNRQATVTIAQITQGRAAAQPPRPVPPGPVIQADVTAMRAALRADFDAADAAWQTWTPN